MCGSDWCVPPLTNEYETSIISFGEDEYGGYLYLLYLKKHTTFNLLRIFEEDFTF
jgi:hypothetical protein